MKLMIGKLLEAGVRDPIVCGILIEGFACSTYIMDLRYEAIYRMIRLATFKLIGSGLNLMPLPSMVRRLVQLRPLKNVSSRKQEAEHHPVECLQTGLELLEANLRN
ncbi:hypothetical protein VTP01DRAFT_8119 [Rhizomucor pusillus]|uniref:uncharacterized protein n=1 Tax=Rhizomucor pusillus TaxID=4840 RepID=UPI003744721D